MTSADPLTPVVAPRRDALDAALRAALAPPGCALRWSAEGVGLRVEVEPPGAGPTLRARLVGGDPPAAARRVCAGGLGLDLLPAGGSTADPRFRALLAAVVARFERGAAGVGAAWAAWRPFAGVEDAHYRRLARSTQGPVGLLRLGFRCNQDCGFCWQDRDWPDPPPGLYATWLDELAAAGAGHVTFTGGEPTLSRDLPALIARAHALGLGTQVQTNAVKLARPGYAQALRDAGLDAVLVSLHAADPAISDAMTRAPGTHVRTLAGIDAALAAGVVVALNTVVDARNAADLPALAALIVARFHQPWPGGGVRVVNLSHPSPYFDGALWADTLAPLDALAGPVGEAVRLLEAAGVPVAAAGTCGFPLCVLPPDSRAARGSPEGSADAMDLAARAYAPACADCAARGRCPGLRREYLERFGDRGVRAIGGG